MVSATGTEPAAPSAAAAAEPAGRRASRAAAAAVRIALAGYAIALACWLVLGLLPTLAGLLPGFRSWLSSVGSGSGPLAAAADRILHPDPDMTPVPPGQALVQYGFSVLNFGLGILLAVRTRHGRPGTRVVPLLLAFALLGTAATFNEPSHRAFHITGSPWPIAAVHFTFHIVSGVTYLWAVVLFPDGRLPVRRQVSPTARSAAIAVVTVAIAAIGWQSSFLSHPQFFVVFFGIGISVAGVGATLWRLRDPRTPPAVRASSRLLWAALLPGLAVALFWCGATVAVLAGDDRAAAAAVRAQEAFPAAFAVVPVVLAAAVARYRLWDIDRLLGRVLIYGSLGALATACYVAAVTAGGVLAGGSVWWAVLALSVIAVAAEPARRVATALINRVVYGQQIDPARAMAELLTGLEHLTPVGMLQQLVAVTVRATRGRAVALYAVDGDMLIRVARAPAAGADSRAELPSGLRREVRTPDLAASLRASHAIEVGYAGRTLGVLATAGDAPNAADRAFLADIAGHAGLLLHNATLTELLQQHVDALARDAVRLRDARRRLVAAEDAERCRLERNLHDGVQQYLVAAIIGLRSVVRTTAADGAAASSAAADSAAAATVVRTARDELRRLSVGELPRGLAGGLAVAVQRSAELLRRAGVPVLVTVDDRRTAIERGSAGWLAAEEAAYYCCAEALQNVLKHADACSVEVEIGLHDGDLAFAVRDDGRGFQVTPAIENGLDRLAQRAGALGGWVAVESAPGHGTRVLGRIPVGATAAAPPTHGPGRIVGAAMGGGVA